MILGVADISLWLSRQTTVKIRSYYVEAPTYPID